MDLEDDAHVTNEIKMTLSMPEQLVEQLVKEVVKRVDIDRIIDDRIEYYFDRHFDINDHAKNLDMYHFTRSITEEVIDTIRERLG